MSGPAKKKAPVFDPLATKEAEQALKPRASADSKDKGTSTAPGKATGKKKDDKAKPNPKGKGAGKDGKPPPSEMKDLELIEPPFECYFDYAKARYYKKSGECWIGVSLDQVRRDLRAHGFSGTNNPGKLVSDQDKVLRYIEEKCCIDYAGSISGRFAGFVEMCGRRFLVKDSPKLPQPCEGEFETIGKYMQGLFGVGIDPVGEIQYAAFKLWIARAWRAIAEQKMHRGHAIIFAGPRKCGKNLLQEDIITNILGGRPVKVASYLMGGSEFNGNLFDGESLMLSDEKGCTDYRDRLAFGDRIKGIVANQIQEMHYKGRDSMSAMPIWRITISVNDEAEHLETLPPVTHADICDKVHLLKVYRPEIPENDDQFKDWKASLMAEIPAWLKHCLSEEVPSELGIDGRMGTQAFQNPELLERLHSLSRESRVLALIDRLLPWESNDLATPAIKEWTGRASDLRKALQDAAGDNRTLQNEIANTIRDDAKCGQYLTRLSELQATKARVLKIEERTGDRRGGYHILPPVAGNKVATNAPG